MTHHNHNFVPQEDGVIDTSGTECFNVGYETIDGFKTYLGRDVSRDHAINHLRNARNLNRPGVGGDPTSMIWDIRLVERIGWTQHGRQYQDVI